MLNNSDDMVTEIQTWPSSTVLKIHEIELMNFKDEFKKLRLFQCWRCHTWLKQVLKKLNRSWSKACSWKALLKNPSASVIFVIKFFLFSLFNLICICAQIVFTLMAGSFSLFFFCERSTTPLSWRRHCKDADWLYMIL